MPIPKPKQNETRRDFIQRCMNDSVMINEYKDANQRVAVCSTQFKNKQQKVFLFINICLYLYYINTKTNKMKIDKIYYWNKELNTYLPCVWNKTFECYTPDLQKKIEKV